MSNYKILDADHNLIDADLMTWAKFIEIPENKIVKQENIGAIRISTVFLGLDHSFGHGPELWFETMAFGIGGKIPMEFEYQERCTTWDEALEMHEKACAQARPQIEGPADDKG
jgi:hypothetical protein